MPTRPTVRSALQGAPLFLTISVLSACAAPQELRDVKMPVYLNDDVPKNLPPNYKVADPEFSVSNKEWTETETNTEYELTTKNGETRMSPRTTQEDVKRTDKNIKDHLLLATKLGATQGGAAILFGSWDLRAMNQDREDTLSGRLIVLGAVNQPKVGPTDPHPESAGSAAPVTSKESAK